MNSHKFEDNEEHKDTKYNLEVKQDKIIAKRELFCQSCQLFFLTQWWEGSKQFQQVESPLDYLKL